MKNTAFFLIRAGMGVNMLFHAVNRFYYGTSAFSGWMVKEFEPTFLPSFTIGAFAAILPFLEGIVGLLLLLGLKTKVGLVAGASIMIFLIIGSCLISKWDWATYQMVYLIFFYVLMEKVEDNRYSVDHFLSK